MQASRSSGQCSALTRLCSATLARSLCRCQCRDGSPPASTFTGLGVRFGVLAAPPPGGFSCYVVVQARTPPSSNRSVVALLADFSYESATFLYQDFACVFDPTQTAWYDKVCVLAVAVVDDAAVAARPSPMTMQHA